MMKEIENKFNNGIIDVSIDTFEKDEVTDIDEVINICKNIKDDKIEIDQVLGMHDEN